jgi:hypothetical protein
MDLADEEKLKRDPKNEEQPYIGYDKSQQCHLLRDHANCSGKIHYGEIFHVYCDCECHRKVKA